MKVLITLDYELFLGSRTGSVENCLTTPMQLLHNAVNEVGARFTIFVDATYLLRTKQLSIGEPHLADEYARLTEHLSMLNEQGHDLQLHIHPHWAYSSYENGEWKLDPNHYKLVDLDREHAISLVTQAKELLDGIIGKKTRAFRAGGFSAQPTEMLTSIFSAAGLIADSSVCPGSVYDSLQQQYDYTHTPDKDIYHFGEDICKESAAGTFLEFPITMHRVSPVFHWKLVANRLTKRPQHRTYGDGISVKTTNESIIARLTSYQNCQATIDGYKITFLPSAYRKHQAQHRELFTVMGHPKLATPFSVDRLRRFAQQVISSGDTFTTISQLLHEQED